MINNKKIVQFLGIAEFVRQGPLPYPDYPVDILSLSLIKSHFIYPVNIKDYVWVFLVGRQFIDLIKKQPISIHIEYEDRSEIAKIEIGSHSKTRVQRKQTIGHKEFILPIDVDASFLFFEVQGLILKPGEYRIILRTGEKDADLGIVKFVYSPVGEISTEQLRAIEADPYSVKSVVYTLNCNNCGDIYKVYAAHDKRQDIQKTGAIWQKDLPDRFTCSCGKTNIPLRYLKESLHGFLGKDIKQMKGDRFSYVRRYTFDQIVEIIKEYRELIDGDFKEEAIQKFIEHNPVLLARFHPKKVYHKPPILDKYKADIAVLDSQNKLIFIELEKSSLKVFTKRGRPTSGLVNAYSQVNDWLSEYSKHPHAILASYGLDINSVMSVKGVVIAGRLNKIDFKHLQTHLRSPIYPDIEFLTTDDLSNSLLEILRDLI